MFRYHSQATGTQPAADLYKQQILHIRWFLRIWFSIKNSENLAVEIQPHPTDFLIYFPPSPPKSNKVAFRPRKYWKQVRYIYCSEWGLVSASSDCQMSNSKMLFLLQKS